MCKIRLRLGPLDGMSIDLGDPAPERVAIGLTETKGGGTALYDLDRDRDGRCYRFAGWQDEESDDTGPDGE